MTDEKKPWKRCPSCKWRVWNDPIDWHAHLELCPARLEKQIDELARIVTTLQNIKTPTPVVVPPPIDFGAIEEPEDDGRWPEEPVEEPTAPEPTEAPLEVPDVAPILPTAAAYYEGPRAIDEYDDEDDEEEASASISRGVMR